MTMKKKEKEKVNNEDGADDLDTVIENERMMSGHKPNKVRENQVQKPV